MNLKEAKKLCIGDFVWVEAIAVFQSGDGKRTLYRDVGGSTGYQVTGLKQFCTGKIGSDIEMEWESGYIEKGNQFICTNRYWCVEIKRNPKFKPKYALLSDAELLV